jgi:hypothetical protein
MKLNSLWASLEKIETISSSNPSNLRATSDFLDVHHEKLDHSLTFATDLWVAVAVITAFGRKKMKIGPAIEFLESMLKLSNSLSDFVAEQAVDALESINPGYTQELWRQCISDDRMLADGQIYGRFQVILNLYSLFMERNYANFGKSGSLSIISCLVSRYQQSNEINLQAAIHKNQSWNFKIDRKLRDISFQLMKKFDSMEMRKVLNYLSLYCTFNDDSIRQYFIELLDLVLEWSNFPFDYFILYLQSVLRIQFRMNLQKDKNSLPMPFHCQIDANLIYLTNNKNNNSSSKALSSLISRIILLPDEIRELIAEYFCFSASPGDLLVNYHDYFRASLSSFYQKFSYYWLKEKISTDINFNPQENLVRSAEEEEKRIIFLIFQSKLIIADPPSHSIPFQKPTRGDFIRTSYSGSSNNNNNNPFNNLLVLLKSMPSQYFNAELFRLFYNFILKTPNMILVSSVFETLKEINGKIRSDSIARKSLIQELITVCYELILPRRNSINSDDLRDDKILMLLYSALFIFESLPVLQTTNKHQPSEDKIQKQKELLSYGKDVCLQIFLPCFELSMSSTTTLSILLSNAEFQGLFEAYFEILGPAFDSSDLFEFASKVVEVFCSLEKSTDLPAPLKRTSSFNSLHSLPPFTHHYLYLISKSLHPNDLDRLKTRHPFFALQIDSHFAQEKEECLNSIENHLFPSESTVSRSISRSDQNKFLLELLQVNSVLLLDMSQEEEVHRNHCPHPRHLSSGFAKEEFLGIISRFLTKHFEFLRTNRLKSWQTLAPKDKITYVKPFHLIMDELPNHKGEAFVLNLLIDTLAATFDELNHQKNLLSTTTSPTELPSSQRIQELTVEILQQVILLKAIIISSENLHQFRRIHSIDIILKFVRLSRTIIFGELLENEEIHEEIRMNLFELYLIFHLSAELLNDLEEATQQEEIIEMTKELISFISQQADRKNHQMISNNSILVSMKQFYFINRPLMLLLQYFKELIVEFLSEQQILQWTATIQEDPRRINDIIFDTIFIFPLIELLCRTLKLLHSDELLPKILTDSFLTTSFLETTFPPPPSLSSYSHSLGDYQICTIHPFIFFQLLSHFYFNLPAATHVTASSSSSRGDLQDQLETMFLFYFQEPRWKRSFTHEHASAWPAMRSSFLKVLVQHHDTKGKFLKKLVLLQESSFQFIDYLIAFKEYLQQAQSNTISSSSRDFFVSILKELVSHSFFPGRSKQENEYSAENIFFLLPFFLPLFVQLQAHPEDTRAQEGGEESLIGLQILPSIFHHIPELLLWIQRNVIANVSTFFQFIQHPLTQNLVDDICKDYGAANELNYFYGLNLLLRALLIDSLMAFTEEMDNLSFTALVEEMKKFDQDQSKSMQMKNEVVIPIFLEFLSSVATLSPQVLSSHSHPEPTKDSSSKPFALTLMLFDWLFFAEKYRSGQSSPFISVAMRRISGYLEKWISHHSDWPDKLSFLLFLCQRLLHLLDENCQETNSFHLQKQCEFLVFSLNSFHTMLSDPRLILSIDDVEDSDAFARILWEVIEVISDLSFVANPAPNNKTSKLDCCFPFQLSFLLAPLDKWKKFFQQHALLDRVETAEFFPRQQDGADLSSVRVAVLLQFWEYVRSSWR